MKNPIESIAVESEAPRRVRIYTARLLIGSKRTEY